MRTCIAVVFPGQGSQSPGMAKHLQAADSSRYREIMGRASEILGWDIERMCREGTPQDLRHTSVTQPAIFVVSILTWDILAASGLRPSYCAGHSLGEYSALVASGCLSFEDGLQLVADRGRLMENASDDSTGMMAVIGSTPEDLKEACRLTSSPGHLAEIANDNSLTQVVLSGHKQALSEVAGIFANTGNVRCVQLPVGGAFHSSLMGDVATAFGELLAPRRLSAFRFPVIPNVLAHPVDDPEVMKKLLVEQITSPVRWRETLETLASLNVDGIIEVGPGRVLSGLARQILPSVETWCTASSSELEKVLKNSSLQWIRL